MDLLNKINRQWLKKWTNALYSYRFILLGAVAIGGIGLAGYLGFRVFEQNQMKKQETEIYQLKKQLSQVEKTHGGDVFSKETNVFSQKKVKDFSLIVKEADQYIQFLQSVPSPQSVHWLAAIELSYFLTQYDQHQKALQMLDAISSKGVSNNWVYQLMLLKLGSLFMKERNYSRAMHVFSLILSNQKSGPFHTEALFKTALCYDALGEWDKAKEIYALIKTENKATLYKERVTQYDYLLKVKQKLQKKR